MPGRTAETRTDTIRHKADVRAVRAAEAAARHEADAAKLAERWNQGACFESHPLTKEEDRSDARARRGVDPDPVPEGAMRVQLQQQSGGRTLHHASRVLRAAGGVTVDQLVASLRELRESEVIPARERAGADLALANAVR